MNYDDKSLKFNKTGYGFLVGVICPCVCFLLYYFFRFSQYSFIDYLHFLGESKKLANVMSITILPNLIPFMLSINSCRYSAGRGVLAATITLGIIIFILKFI